MALERNREVAAWIKEAGHEPCSHGWRWEEVWLLSRSEEMDHIRRAIDSIKETCGERPSGWYCRYGPSVNTRELLVEEGGFVYDSDAYNDDLPYYVEVKGKRHLVIPYSMTYNDGKFGLLPSYGSPADFLDNLKRGLDQLWDEGETHPRMMSHRPAPAPDRAGQPRPCAPRVHRIRRRRRARCGSPAGSISPTGGTRITGRSRRDARRSASPRHAGSEPACQEDAAVGIR